MPRSAASRSVIWLKPPRDEREAVAEPRRVRTSVRAPGASSIASYTCVERRLASTPCEQRDPLAQRLLEVELAAHRRPR